jgi:hypothetical protein
MMQFHLDSARTYLELYKATGLSHYKMKAKNQLCMARIIQLDKLLGRS